MIDWARVGELRSEIGVEDFAEVVEMFVDEADEVIERLCKMNDAEIGNALHFLKGMALNLGFTGLAKLCNEGETMLATDGATGTGLAGIVACYEDSKRRLKGGVGTMAALRSNQEFGQSLI